MRTMILLSLFSFPAFAQELQGPTDEDLIAVSFNILDESQKAIAPNKDIDCNEKNSEKNSKTKVSAPPVDEVVCLCELDNKKQSLLGLLIGDIKESEIVIGTGNDNFLHGLLQLSPNTYGIDGDDRGRTFGANGEYKVMGSEGSLSFKYDAVGFGKFNYVNGYRKDSTGKYYLNFHDVDTFSSRYDRFFNKKEDGDKAYVFGQFDLAHEIEEGGTSQKIQHWWHETNKDSLGDHKTIQYHYLKENDDKTTGRIVAGIGKEWIANLGNWKCASKAEMALGLSASKSKMTPEIAARLESSLSHSSAKWIALSGWTSAGSGFLGKTYEGGMTLRFPIKTKKYSVEPFIGIERHKTSLDKKYGEVSGHPYENYHVLGVTIKY
jgi:hypothetical protein